MTDYSFCLYPSALEGRREEFNRLGMELVNSFINSFLRLREEVYKKYDKEKMLSGHSKILRQIILQEVVDNTRRADSRRSSRTIFWRICLWFWMMGGIK